MLTPELDAAMDKAAIAVLFGNNEQKKNALGMLAVEAWTFGFNDGIEAVLTVMVKAGAITEAVKANALEKLKEGQAQARQEILG